MYKIFKETSKYEEIYFVPVERKKNIKKFFKSDAWIKIFSEIIEKYKFQNVYIAEYPRKKNYQFLFMSLIIVCRGFF